MILSGTKGLFRGGGAVSQIEYTAQRSHSHQRKSHEADTRTGCREPEK